jgi:hypothetical protein
MRKPKTKKKKSLSPKQKALMRLLAQGSDRKTAALLAGYSPKNPDQSAYQALKHLGNSFPELLDKHGLTDSHLIQKYLKPLLKTRRTKHFAHNGMVKSVRHYADNDTRIAALDMTFRLKGTYAPLKTQNASRAVDVIVVDIPRPIHTPDDDDAEIVPPPASNNG